MTWLDRITAAFGVAIGVGLFFTLGSCDERLPWCVDASAAIQEGGMWRRPHGAEVCIP